MYYPSGSKLICHIPGNRKDKMRRVKEAKERERNQKGMAQRRSELLQDQPIIPNLANVESKLKAILLASAKTNDQSEMGLIAKRNAKPAGKVCIHSNMHAHK